MQSIYRAVLYAAFFCLVVARGARADSWSLTTADLEAQKNFTVQKNVSVNEWGMKEGLSYTTENGQLNRVATRQAVMLGSSREKHAPATGWQLTLRNNDVLEGSPAGLRDQFLQFKTAELGTVEVPLKVIAGLQLHGTKSNRTAPADHDSVLLKNGDSLDGVLVGLTATKAQVQGDLGSTDVDLDRVERITLGGAVAPRQLPALAVRVTFISGSVLTTMQFNWTVNSVALGDPSGQERKCTPDQIAAVEVIGGRVVWLTELDPVKDVQVSYFDAKWPTQINRNVMGGPLVVDKVTYERGLGVHTRSVLAYDLDGSFSTLNMRVGMDDSAMPLGEAHVFVVLDGKVVYDVKRMKAGAASEAVALPIGGGKRLELHAEPAEHLDVLGRVDWINPALVRP